MHVFLLHEMFSHHLEPDIPEGYQIIVCLSGFTCITPVLFVFRLSCKVIWRGVTAECRTGWRHADADDAVALSRGTGISAGRTLGTRPLQLARKHRLVTAFRLFPTRGRRSLTCVRRNG